MIRVATPADFDQIWPIFHDVVSQGDTYVYDPSTPKSLAFDIWMNRPIQTFVFEHTDGTILGTYYLKENRPDLGSHICRCGFMVSSNVRRQRIGEQMCEHSFKIAKEFGFRGMQLGYVVSTNLPSVQLWLKMGFQHVGTVPQAFAHRTLGDVDVFIMYRSLTN
tara:strand:- start:842 stop:1330 length:489 start_codon:yes stop_codon:yes gene_type:complete